MSTLAHWIRETFTSANRLSDVYKYAISAALLALLTILSLPRKKPINFSTINAYPNDIGLKKAHAAFLTNARGLIAEGIRKFNSPFRLLTPLGPRIILPASYTPWLRTSPSLSHIALVHDEYMASYPGMAGNAAVTDPRQILTRVAKTKLNVSPQCAVLNAHLRAALHERWGEGGEWHGVAWGEDIVGMVGRMSAAVFVGEELAVSEEWQGITVGYTAALFEGIRAVRNTHPLLRPFSRYLLPEIRACETKVAQARALLGPVLAAREEAKRRAVREGRKPGEEFDDAIAWMEDAAGGRPMDAVAGQLGFAIAALHTTTELLRQSLLDIVTRGDKKLLGEIREEVRRAVQAVGGWTTKALAEIRLLDSAVKETQRLKPQLLVNLERKVMQDVVLPDGLVLPKGTNVAVDSSAMWSEEYYAEPLKWDAYRFLKLREGGDASAQVAATSERHYAFGIGKPVCPGRFFAANEVKIALAGILVGYDVRVVGKKPVMLEMGFEMLSDPKVQVEVRRR